MSLYVPAHFAAPDFAAIARLVRDFPFATLVTPAEPEPAISHLPLLHERSDSGPGTLIGHFARANAHWKVAAAPSIAIFHGPHAYVSPSWYREPAINVPTWNYVAVHLHGSLELAADEAGTRAIVDALVARFEGSRPAPWRIGPDRSPQDAKLAGIVGFRMRIDRVEASFKLSQNRSAEDRTRVADGLAREAYAEAAALAAWMRDGET